MLEHTTDFGGPAQLGDLLSNAAMAVKPNASTALTLIESTGQLSKTIGLAPDGGLQKSGSVKLYRGTATRLALSGTATEQLEQLSAHLSRLNHKQAIICAPPPAGADVRPLVSKDELAENPKALTRTKENFQHSRGPALLGLDCDTAEFPPELLRRLEPGNISSALAEVWPPFATAARLIRPSASSGIVVAGSENGPTNSGHHRFFIASDGSQVPTFVQNLADRLMLRGFLWGKITKVGTVLPRTLFDVDASKDESRLFYEADAVLADERLRYDRRAREPQCQPGDILDVSGLAPLSPEEQTQLAELKDQLQRDLEPQARAQRERWEEERRSALVAKGTSPEKAARIVSQARETHDLAGDWLVELDDGTAVTAAEVMADRQRFHGMTCADPLEPDYNGGKNVAIIYSNSTPPIIYSHAHGGMNYQLPTDTAEWFDKDALAEDPPSPINRGWINPVQWEGKPIPEREWEVEGWIPKGETTLLYGDGGVGKTLIMHQYATCAATGQSWLGQKTRPARVMCFFCEDSEDELMRRQRDINAMHGLSFSDLGNLRLNSRRNMDNLLALWDRNTGEMKRQAVWSELAADARAFRADVILLDTLADIYAGDEVSRAQVTAFVKSCLGRLAAEIGGTVIALGHVSVAGRSSGSGTSGSTAWSNAVRSRLYLRYPKGAETGNIRELETMKSNYGPKGNMLKLRWHRGAFDVLAGSTRSSDVADGSGVPTLDKAVDDAVVSVLLSNQGQRLTMASNSQYYAPKRLKKLEPATLSAFGAAEIEGALDRLQAAGIIREDVVGRDNSSRPMLGFAVVTDKLSSSKSALSVFD